MTDRELLELAAKAAGLRPHLWNYTENRGLQYNVNPSNVWNPLTDDGDALRLAVKLGINIMLGGANKRFAFVSATTDGNLVVEETDEEYKSDIYSATRRAIVRAAAEIGKEMK